MGETMEEKLEHKAERSGKDHSHAKKKPEHPAQKRKEKKTKEVRTPQKELGELREKAALADQYLDRLVRLQADFENFRKRKEKERLELIKYATEGLVCELVPVLTNFERALAAAEKASELKGFADGIEIIIKQLKKALKEHGVQEICPLNAPFDPHKHEAVEKVITNDHPEGHVVEVYQSGYALNDRVLQPAAVKVAAAPPLAPGEEGDEKQSPCPEAQNEGKSPEEKSENEKSHDSIEEG